MPPRVSVAVTADEVPCATALKILEGEKLLGTLSTNVAVVTVFGPAFVMMREKVIV